MKKLKMLIAACTLLGASPLWAQQDITDTYLTNADFEGSYSIDGESGVSSDRAIYIPNGWTVTRTNGNANDMTVLQEGNLCYNTFVTPTEETTPKIWADDNGQITGKTYRVRERWGNSQSFMLSQNVTLPAGTYRLTVTAAAHNGTMTIFAGDNQTGVTTAGIWYPVSVDFTLNSEQTISIGMQMGRNAENEQFAGVDNFKLYKFADVEASATSLVPYNMTDKIANASCQVSGSWTKIDGQATVNNSELYSNTYCGTAMEAWTSYTSGTRHFETNTNIIYQTTSETLPAGFYRMTAVGTAWNQTVSPAAIGEGMFLFANDGTKDLGTSEIASKTFKEVSLDFLLSETHQLTLGLKTGASTTTNWATLSQVKLYRIGSIIDFYCYQLETLQSTAIDLLNDEIYSLVQGSERTELTAQSTATAVSETVEAYQTTIAAVQSAIDAFIAANEQFELLAREMIKARSLGMSEATVNEYAATSESNAETILTKIKNLKVAEYDYVMTTYPNVYPLGEWSSSGTNTSADDLNNEHWSGKTHSYKNQYDEGNQGWNANSWSINFNQNIMLPAGEYVFKVAGRQALGNDIVTSLIVKQGATVLGSIDDFPRGNASRGIDITGATKFDGEDSEFANNGLGYGWEWRYVKFVLDEAATVNIAVNAVATAIHQWVSFGDYTIQMSLEQLLVFYNQALTNARNARDNAAYGNVTGTERTALLTAISTHEHFANETPTENDAMEIYNATVALNNATATFKAAMPAYNTYIETQTVANALPGSISVSNITSASTAASLETALETINVAEYNAVTTNYTYDATTYLLDGIVYNWTVNGGSIEERGNEDWRELYINYYDLWNNSTIVTMSQTVTLPKAKYVLMAPGRSSSFGALTMSDGTTTVTFPYKGNTGLGVNKADVASFDNSTPNTFANSDNGYGWEYRYLPFESDGSTPVTLTFTWDTRNGAWASLGSHRYSGEGNIYNIKLLAMPGDVSIDENTAYTPESQIANVTLTRTITANKWNTITLPFALTDAETKTAFGSDTQIAAYSENSANANNATVNFNTTADATIAANTPVLLKTSTAGSSYTFSNRLIETETAKVEGTNFDFIGIYSPGNITAGDYFISDNKLWEASDNTNTIKGTRATIKPHIAEARIAHFFISDEQVTSVNGISTDNTENNKLYNLNGQRVKLPSKGLYIMNGQKIIIK